MKLLVSMTWITVLVGLIALREGFYKRDEKIIPTEKLLKMADFVC